MSLGGRFWALDAPLQARGTTPVAIQPMLEARWCWRPVPISADVAYSDLR